MRELRNVIERATIVAEGRFIERARICRRSSTAAHARRAAPPALHAGHDGRRGRAAADPVTLQHTGGNKTRAAELLGISLKTLHNKLQPPEDQEAGRRRLMPMRLSIKTKQVAGVTVDRRPGGRRPERAATWRRSRASASWRARRAATCWPRAIYQRAREVVASGRPDPHRRAARGPRPPVDSRVERVLENVLYAAIVDRRASSSIAHSDSARIGQPLPPSDDLDACSSAGPFRQLRAIYTDGGRRSRSASRC